MRAPHPLLRHERFTRRSRLDTLLAPLVFVMWFAAALAGLVGTVMAMPRPGLFAASRARRLGRGPSLIPLGSPGVVSVPVGKSAGAGSTPLVTDSFLVQRNDLVLVFIGMNDVTVGAGPTGVSGLGVTFSQVAFSGYWYGNPAYGWLYAGMAPADAIGQVTVTRPNMAQGAIAVEVARAKGYILSTIDSASAGANTPNPANQNVDLGGAPPADALMLAISTNGYSADSARNVTIGSGYTELPNRTVSNLISMDWGYKIGSGPQVAAFTGTHPTYNWGVAVVALAPASNLLTYSFTGGDQFFTVPPGVTRIGVDMSGAEGGPNGGSYLGGQGGRVRCSLPVTPGETLKIRVGGMGVRQGTIGYHNGGPGTASFNGGGAAAAGQGTTNNDGGSGGGASDIRRGAYALADRLVVAGGGGGQGGGKGLNGTGHGGGLAGAAGMNSGGAGGGTATAGGAGGAGTVDTGAAGSLGQGGAGASLYGGGGGGGYYGGGGGGQESGPGGGGGGGGSSFTHASCTNVAHTQGGRTGNGVVTIFWPAQDFLFGDEFTGTDGVPIDGRTPDMPGSVVATWQGFWNHSQIVVDLTGDSAEPTLKTNSTSQAGGGTVDLGTTDVRMVMEVGPRFFGAESLLARFVTAPGSGTQTYLELRVNADSQVSLSRVVNGGGTELYASANGAVANGDLVELEVVGDYVIVRSNGTVLWQGAGGMTGALLTSTRHGVYLAPGGGSARVRSVMIYEAAGGVEHFAYTGGAQYYVVPPGVTSLEVELYGARGGHSVLESWTSNGRGQGGGGAYVKGRYAVTPGEVLQVNVGGKGGDTQNLQQSGGAGGFNGGAGGGGGSSASYVGGGGGGGATDIRRGAFALADRLVIAGAGGGGGGPNTGTWTDNQQGGGGGSSSTDGRAGTIGRAAATAGGGGTQAAGGAASAQGGGAAAGTLGAGGSGGRVTTGSGGGGGGGGYYGGGGGSNGNGASGGSGGGGGSSYVGAGTATVVEPGASFGHGLAVIRPVVAAAPLHPNPVDPITVNTLLNQGLNPSSTTTIVSSSVAPAANRLILVAIAFGAQTPGSDTHSLSGLGLSWTWMNYPPIPARGALSGDWRYRWVFYRAVTGGSAPTPGAITFTTSGLTTTHQARFLVFEFANTKLTGTNGADGIAAIRQDHVRTNASTVNTPMPFSNVHGAEFTSEFASPKNAGIAIAHTTERPAGGWDASGPHAELVDANVGDNSNFVGWVRADFLDRPARYGLSFLTTTDEKTVGIGHFELAHATS